MLAVFIILNYIRKSIVHSAILSGFKLFFAFVDIMLHNEMKMWAPHSQGMQEVTAYKISLARK